MSLGVGEKMTAACAGKKKTCEGGEEKRAASLMAPDARKSSGKEEAAWKAAVGHVGSEKSD